MLLKLLPNTLVLVGGRPLNVDVSILLAPPVPQAANIPSSGDQQIDHHPLDTDVLVVQFIPSGEVIIGLVPL